MYLCKIAMDIVAKHIKADKDGVRIAELDEMSYRKETLDHRPLTDFWRVGKGYAKKLEEIWPLIRWVILPDVPSEKRMNYITKICYINCLALMQTLLSEFMPGDKIPVVP